jgi:hypothetical protein
MKLRKRQQGMTMWGMIFVIAVIAFVVFITFKLFPPYMADFKVKAAFDSLGRQADAGAMSRDEIANALSKRFDIDDISHVNLSDLKIEQAGKNRVIRLDYEVEVPIAANLYVLLKFEHYKQVRSSE